MGTLVFLETHDGEPTKGSLGVLGKAVSLGGDVSGVVLGIGGFSATGLVVGLMLALAIFGVGVVYFNRSEAASVDRL